MDYEILNPGALPAGVINGFCPAGLGCPNNICANGVCPTPNENCGNSFPCENPGFGCRTGCGGAVGEVCIEPDSF